ncbi:unnamed protein product [Medioppia subpectinata]|uniref:Uncharacterized protein n=1 Tax=Medioppia subpectinata TaxID=1979941 RepID=A0A7R9L879_9ACAR|nr:unnamed protein product [Medioppia subpectinata]CAG2116291.1 unnamed protein product [Medioppia subpectinata]
MYSVMIYLTIMCGYLPFILTQTTKAECIEFGKKIEDAGGIKQFVEENQLQFDMVYEIYKNCFINEEGFRFKKGRYSTATKPDSRGKLFRRFLLEGY